MSLLIKSHKDEFPEAYPHSGMTLRILMPWNWVSQKHIREVRRAAVYSRHAPEDDPVLAPQSKTDSLGLEVVDMFPMIIPLLFLHGGSVRGILCFFFFPSPSEWDMETHKGI